MKQNRVDRIMAALKEMGLHQMLIVDPMSIYYLTGVYVSPFERFYGLYLREDGHHAFFLNRLFTVPQEVGIEKVWYSDTDPAMEMTATSVVPPPMSTTRLPNGLVTSIPAPIAAAIGSSTRNTSLAPA